VSALAHHSTSRRGFLKGTFGGVAALCLVSGEASRAAGPYGPFQVGIQTYSLRAFDRARMLQLVQELDLRFIESVDNHFPRTADKAVQKQYRQALKAANVKLVATYTGFGQGDAAADRALFEYARAMRIECLVGDPMPEHMGTLDELVEQFGINVAIHNHGPGTRYDKIQDVLDAMAGHHARIGACIDYGHFIRSDEDPLSAIRAFGRRIYDVHLKDVTSDKVFTELGKGALDLEGSLKQLHKQGFEGPLVLEYEEHAEDPMPYIRECLATLRQAIKHARLA
jgi:sugar phosphate isomerase/epimerase